MSEGSSTSCRVVLADDHPAILDALLTLLEGEDDMLVVGTAPDGDQALHLIETRLVDVAVLDVNMPPHGALDVVRRLNAAISPTKIILYTGDSTSGTIPFLDLGVRGYLLKDAPLDNLLEAIRVVAAGGTYIDGLLAKQVLDAMKGTTARQRRELLLLSRGAERDEIATELMIAPTTLKNELRRSIHALGARTAIEAVANALRRALIH